MRNIISDLRVRKVFIFALIFILGLLLCGASAFYTIIGNKEDSPTYAEGEVTEPVSPIGGFSIRRTTYEYGSPTAVCSLAVFLPYKDDINTVSPISWALWEHEDYNFYTGSSSNEYFVSAIFYKLSFDSNAVEVETELSGAPTTVGDYIFKFSYKGCEEVSAGTYQPSETIEERTVRFSIKGLLQVEGLTMDDFDYDGNNFYDSISNLSSYATDHHLSLTVNSGGLGNVSLSNIRVQAFKFESSDDFAALDEKAIDDYFDNLASSTSGSGGNPIEDASTGEVKNAGNYIIRLSSPDYPLVSVETNWQNTFKLTIRKAAITIPMLSAAEARAWIKDKTIPTTKGIYGDIERNFDGDSNVNGYLYGLDEPFDRRTLEEWGTTLSYLSNGTGLIASDITAYLNFMSEGIYLGFLTNENIMTMLSFSGSEGFVTKYDSATVSEKDPDTGEEIYDKTITIMAMLTDYSYTNATGTKIIDPIGANYTFSGANEGVYTFPDIQNYGRIVVSSMVISTQTSPSLQYGVTVANLSYEIWTSTENPVFDESNKNTLYVCLGGKVTDTSGIFYDSEGNLIAGKVGVITSEAEATSYTLSVLPVFAKRSQEGDVVTFTDILGVELSNFMGNAPSIGTYYLYYKVFYNGNQVTIADGEHLLGYVFGDGQFVLKVYSDANIVAIWPKELIAVGEQVQTTKDYDGKVKAEVIQEGSFELVPGDDAYVKVQTIAKYDSPYPSLDETDQRKIFINYTLEKANDSVSDAMYEKTRANYVFKETEKEIANATINRKVIYVSFVGVVLEGVFTDRNTSESYIDPIVFSKSAKSNNPDFRAYVEGEEISLTKYLIKFGNYAEGALTRTIPKYVAKTVAVQLQDGSTGTEYAKDKWGDYIFEETGETITVPADNYFIDIEGEMKTEGPGMITNFSFVEMVNFMGVDNTTLPGYYHIGIADNYRSSAYSYILQTEPVMLLIEKMESPVNINLIQSGEYNGKYHKDFRSEGDADYDDTRTSIEVTIDANVGSGDDGNGEMTPEERVIEQIKNSAYSELVDGVLVTYAKGIHYKIVSYGIDYAPDGTSATIDGLRTYNRMEDGYYLINFESFSDSTKEELLKFRDAGRYIIEAYIPETEDYARKIYSIDTNNQITLTISKLPIYGYLGASDRFYLEPNPNYNSFKYLALTDPEPIEESLREDFTIYYHGFVNGDESKQILDLQHMAVNYTGFFAKTEPGVYRISLYGGRSRNYSFTSIGDARFTIKKLDATISTGLEGSQQSRPYNARIQFPWVIFNGDEDMMISQEQIDSFYETGYYKDAASLVMVNYNEGNKKIHYEVTYYYNEVYEDGHAVLDESDESAIPKDAGTYYITVTCSCVIYNPPEPLYLILTITKTDTVIEYEKNQSVVYNTMVHEPAFTVNNEESDIIFTIQKGIPNDMGDYIYNDQGFVNGYYEEYHYTVFGNEDDDFEGNVVYEIINSGFYFIKIEFSPTKNYTTPDPIYIWLTVRKAETSLELTDDTSIYNGLAVTSLASYNVVPFVSPDKIEWQIFVKNPLTGRETRVSEAKNAGTYTFRAKAEGSENYNESNWSSGQLIIFPATLTALVRGKVVEDVDPNNVPDDIYFDPDMMQYRYRLQKTYGEPNPVDKVEIFYRGFIVMVDEDNPGEYLVFENEENAEGFVPCVIDWGTMDEHSSSSITYQLKAKNGAATNYEFSYSTSEFVILKAKAEIIIISDTNEYIGEPQSIEIRLNHDQSGAVVTKRPVIVTVDEQGNHVPLILWYGFDSEANDFRLMTKDTAMSWIYNPNTEKYFALKCGSIEEKRVIGDYVTTAYFHGEEVVFSVIYTSNFEQQSYCRIYDEESGAYGRMLPYARKNTVLYNGYFEIRYYENEADSLPFYVEYYKETEGGGRKYYSSSKVEIASPEVVSDTDTYVWMYNRNSNLYDSAQPYAKNVTGVGNGGFVETHYYRYETDASPFYTERYRSVGGLTQYYDSEGNGIATPPVYSILKREFYEEEGGVYTAVGGRSLYYFENEEYEKVYLTKEINYDTVSFTISNFGRDYISYWTYSDLPMSEVKDVGEYMYVLSATASPDYSEVKEMLAPFVITQAELEIHFYLKETVEEQGELVNKYEESTEEKPYTMIYGESYPIFYFGFSGYVGMDIPDESPIYNISQGRLALQEERGLDAAGQKIFVGQMKIPESYFTMPRLAIPSSAIDVLEGGYIVLLVEGTMKNYRLVCNLPAHLVIVPRKLVVRANDSSPVVKPYDGTTKAVVAEKHYIFGDDAGRNGIIKHPLKAERDVVNLSTVAWYDGSNVTTQAVVTISDLMIDNQNYDLETLRFTAVGVIEKYIPKVILIRREYVYDGESKTIQPSITGFGDEQVAFEITYLGMNNTIYLASSVPPVDAGEYEVTVVTNDPNYAVVSNITQLVITKTNVNISFGNDNSQVYGSVIGLTAFAIGLSNYNVPIPVEYYEQSTGNKVNISDVGVGVYEVKASYPTTKNYSASEKISYLTITARDTEVTFENEGEYVYSGNAVNINIVFVDRFGEKKSLSPSYFDELGLPLNSAPSEVGTYKAKASSFSNYVFTGIVETTFTITKANLVISIKNATALEGEPANVVFSYSVNGGVAQGSVPGLAKSPKLSYFDERTQSYIVGYPESRGVYRVLPAEEESKNYNITYTVGELVVIAKRVIADTNYSDGLIIEGAFSPDATIAVQLEQVSSYTPVSSSFDVFRLNNEEYSNTELGQVYTINMESGSVMSDYASESIITLYLEPSLRGKESYSVAHFMKDGTVEILIGEYNGGDSITFRVSDSIEGSYAVIKEQTKEGFNLWYIAAIAGAVLLIVIALIIIKKKA